MLTIGMSSGFVGNDQSKCRKFSGQDAFAKHDETSNSTEKLAGDKSLRERKERRDEYLPRTYHRRYAHHDVPSLRSGHSLYASLSRDR